MSATNDPYAGLAKLCARDLRARWFHGWTCADASDVTVQGIGQPQAWTTVLVAAEYGLAVVSESGQLLHLTAGEGLVAPEFASFQIVDGEVQACACARWRLAGTVDVSQLIGWQIYPRQAGEEIFSCIKNLCDSAAVKDVAGVHILSHALQTMQHLTALLSAMVVGVPQLRLEHFSAERLQRLQPVLLYMQDHLAEPIQRGDLAAMLGLSEGRFHDVFKDIFRVPPMVYLQRLRMTQAQRLLLTTSMPIQEVGRRVGYEDAFHFSRTFKKLFGISPRAYRQQ